MGYAEQLVRRYIDVVWNSGDLQSFDRMTSLDFQYCLAGNPTQDRAAFRRFVTETRAAFPDWKVEVAQVIVDDGAVAARWSAHATHQGNFRGLPPTGRAIDVTGINIYQIENGVIIREWEQMDSLRMLQQLGMPPA